MRKKLIRKVLITLILLFTVIVPVIAVIIGVILFRQLPYKHMVFKEAERLESRLVTPEEKTVKPSEVLAQKAKYADQYLVVRGKVVPEPVICERRTCPKSDSCCGCKSKKNLIVVDADAPFLADSPGRLPIFAPGKEPFCTRRVGSCSYDCQDWKLSSIYDVEGTFFAEAPLAGSGITSYMDFYFEVEGKSPVTKVEALSLPEKFLGNLKELIKKLRTSGYYVR